LISRGARVFASSGELPGIDHVAAENPDKTRVLVLTNANSTEEHVQCRLGTHTLKLVVPADSITSYVW
jgi:glucosylceramidase